VIRHHRLHQTGSLEIGRTGVLPIVGSETIHVPLRQTEPKSVNVEVRKKKKIPLTTISYPADLIRMTTEIVMKYTKLRALLLQ
jgi:hypothetical protein